MKHQQSHMVHDAGNQKGCCRVKHTNLGNPFHGVGFPDGGNQRTDAGHVEADGKNERQIFRFSEVRCENVGNAGGAACYLGAEGGAYQTATRAVKAIQDAEQGLLGNCRIPCKPAGGGCTFFFSRAGRSTADIPVRIADASFSRSIMGFSFSALSMVS